MQGKSTIKGAIKMTERFTIDVIDDKNWLIQDTVTGGDANPLDGTANVLKGLIKLLNEQDNEIKELHDKIAVLKTELHVCEKPLFSKRQLHEENQKLKNERNYFERKKTEYLVSLNGCRLMNAQLKSSNMEYEDALARLEEKNEQLKQTMQEVAELLSEEVDLFSDKATEHDINAYMELKQLDNKDAYYMAVSTKKAIKMLKGDVE